MKPETGSIAILPKLNETLVNLVQAAAPGWTIHTGKEVTDDQIRTSQIVVGWRKGLENAVLATDSQVRWVQSWSAGMDHLEIERYLDRGIELTSANGVHAYPISETIFAMLLSFTRNLHKYIRNQQEKKWDHGGLKLELHGKTLGLVGVGAIGEETARIAKAFGMRVLGVRRSAATSVYVDEMFAPSALRDMLPFCDYVVLTVPATVETTRWFGEREFQAMKPSAFFVNIGRGATVHTDALIHALREGVIAGAGLDVFEEEPLPKEHPLWEMENVMISPHSAGSTEYYTERAMDIFLANLAFYLEGKPPALNRLLPNKLY